MKGEICFRCYKNINSTCCWKETKTKQSKIKFLKTNYWCVTGFKGCAVFSDQAMDASNTSSSSATIALQLHNGKEAKINNPKIIINTNYTEREREDSHTHYLLGWYRVQVGFPSPLYRRRRRVPNFVLEWDSSFGRNLSAFPKHHIYILFSTVQLIQIVITISRASDLQW